MTLVCEDIRHRQAEPRAVIVPSGNGSVSLDLRQTIIESLVSGRFILGMASMYR